MAGVWNFTYDQGTDFARSLRLYQADKKTPINLTNCTIRGQIRLSPQDGAVINLQCSIIDATNGRIEVAIPADASNSLAVTGLRYNDYTTAVYDIEIVDSTGKVRRLLNGTVKISPEVTKA